MKTITRDELKQRLVNDGPTLIEVLSPEDYQEFHLPGAINVPVGGDFDQKIQQAVPEKDRTVVVYCLNEKCDASPRAARRMDELGYTSVFDYEAGKTDWRAAGLPVEE